MINALLIAMPRSGTQHLTSLLDSHPDCVMHGELFRAPREIGVFRGRLGEDTRAGRVNYRRVWLRNLAPLRFVDRVLNYDPDVAVSGYKHFIDQNPRLLRKLLRTRRYRVLLLERENRLGAFSSRRIVQQSGISHVHAADDIDNARQKIVFDESDFLDFVRYTDAAYARIRELLAELELPCLELRYGAMAQELPDVIDFLGLRADAALHSPHQKINPATLTERFANPQAVRDCLNHIGRPEWAAEH